MSTEEQGAFLRLMADQWNSHGEGLPTDPEALKALMGFDRPRRKPRPELILSAFEEVNGRLFNRKVSEQWQDSLAHRERRADAGRKGGNAKAMLGECQSNALASPRGERESEREIQEGIYEVEEGTIGGEGQPDTALPGSDPVPAPASPYPPDFESFWREYPVKVGKGDALKAWGQTRRERPAVEDIVARVWVLRASQKWTDEGGKFIPHPATWLRRHGWLDEPGREAQPSHLGGDAIAARPINRDDPGHRLWVAYNRETDPEAKERMRLELEALAGVAR